MNMFLTAGQKPDYLHQSQCLKLRGEEQTLHRRRFLKCHPSAVGAFKNGASTEIIRMQVTHLASLLFPEVFFTQVVCYVQHWSLLGTQLIIITNKEERNSFLIVIFLSGHQYFIYHIHGDHSPRLEPLGNLSSVLPEALFPHSQKLP